jgi:2-succinyl-6-hydroxy-2,4-cyclohexadiene-1-carboxylate synthase
MALMAALEYPDLIERLVLVSASPGIADGEARAERQARDHRLADHIESVGVETFLDEWLAGPIAGTAHVDEERRKRDRAIRSENTATGLAAALRGIGQGAQPYVGDRIRELEVPVLTVSGRLDAAYTKLARQMADAADAGVHVSVKAAGHNVVLDAPGALRRALAGFGIP